MTTILPRLLVPASSDAVMTVPRLARTGRYSRDQPWTWTSLCPLGSSMSSFMWGLRPHWGHVGGAGERHQCGEDRGRRLFISIYNDQGAQSRVWTRIKRRYNKSGALERWALLHCSAIYLRTGSFAAATYRSLSGRPARRARRSMDRRNDTVDWVGGYAFEVAKPEQIFDFFRLRGFALQRLKTCGGRLGCNEFVFRRESLL